MSTPREGDSAPERSSNGLKRIVGYTTRFFSKAKSRIDTSVDKIKCKVKKGKTKLLLHRKPSNSVVKRIAKMSEENIKSYLLQNSDTMSFYHKRLLLIALGNESQIEVLRTLVQRGANLGELSVLCQQVRYSSLEEIVSDIGPIDESAANFPISSIKVQPTMLRRLKNLVEKFRSTRK